MQIIDPGHDYNLDTYDGTGHYIPLTFMKREGTKYPGNKGHYSGTNCQEVLRILIDRLKYLNKQVPCKENTLIISYLRKSIVCLERRAAERHGFNLSQGSFWPTEVENIPTCKVCGHIECKHLTNSNGTVKVRTDTINDS